MIPLKKTLAKKFTQKKKIFFVEIVFTRKEGEYVTCSCIKSTVPWYKLTRKILTNNSVNTPCIQCPEFVTETLLLQNTSRQSLRYS